MASSPRTDATPTATVHSKQSWWQRVKSSLSISFMSGPFFPEAILPKTKRVYVNLDVIPTNSAPFSSLSKHDLLKRHLEEARFVSNKVVTTQYSIFTFIPKNLYHQFRRVANFFFLVIVILQCIAPFQSLEPVVSALPLVIIVGLTAARDGFEDWKRHEVDQTVNHRETLGLHNWRNVTMERKLAHRHHRRHRVKYAQYMPLNTDHTSKRSWAMQYAVAWAHWSEERWGSVLKMCRNGSRRIRRTMGDRWRSTQPNHASANSHETGEPESTPPVIGFKYRYLQQSRETVNNNQHPAGELYRLTESPPNGDISQPYWRPRLWKDVYEGDLVLLRKNDFIPADLLILSSSEQEPICYVETMNLDGETNLKIRQCVPGLSDLCTPEECAQKRFWVESEGPTNNLLKYHGAVVFPPDHDQESKVQGGEQMQSTTGCRRIGIDLNHLLLRGCVLRNTEWVIGLVIFTGSDTKLQMNSGHVPSKRSNIEHKMNRQITINLVVMAVICAFIAFMSRRWESRFQNVGAPSITNDSSSSYHSAAYSSFVSFIMSVITFQNLVPVALYLTVEGVKTIQAYFIFQDLELYYKERNVPCMPRSWNLSDDLGQIEYIFSDKTGTLTTNQMEFKKCTIQGQVFEFYPGVHTTLAETPAINGSRRADSEQDQPFAQHPIQGNKDHWHDHTMDMEILDDNAVFQENKDPEFEHFHPGEQPRRRSSHNTLVDMDSVLTSSGLGIASMNESESSWDSHSRGLLQADSAFQPEQRKSRSRSSSMATAALIELTALASTQSSNDQYSQYRYEFSDQVAISKDVVSDPQPSGSSSVLQDAKDNFFLILSICHTVLVSSVASEFDINKDSDDGLADGRTTHQTTQYSNSSPVIRSTPLGGFVSDDAEDGDLFRVPQDTEYQAQSPDELALVIASKGLGYTFLGREVDVILMAHPYEAEPRRYKIMNVLEFNSTRKRMSVIVKRLQTSQNQESSEDVKDEILLLTKGADNIIFERLASGQEQLVENTTAHLQDFARDGLRTLCLAYRSLDVDQYERWSARHHFAATYVEGVEQDSSEDVSASYQPHTGSSKIQPFQNSDPPHDSALRSTGYAIKDSFATHTRQEMLEELAEEMERDLQLLGATGIEDRLQEGVPETIRLLKRAGIKIWVLTGDKMETAISIGVSTGLLSHGHQSEQVSRTENKVDCQYKVSSSSSQRPISVNGHGQDLSGVHLTMDDSDPEARLPPSKCPDMELILIRGDYEPEKDLVPKKSSSPTRKEGLQDEKDLDASSFSGSSNRGDSIKEHSVMAQIRTALDSFSKDSPQSLREQEPGADKKADSPSDTTWQNASGFVDYMPWKLYEKWNLVNSAFAKPFQRSINSAKKREAQLQPREGQNTALVIDGLALKFALEDPMCKDLLLELACQCTAVICCRVSPLQKAMVVKMVKDAKQVMTLSIGDGANDVSMIQEAHIGVGVAGEEGLQAVMASDYSIGQFRFLTRLLLVHGHYAYLRNTSMVMLFIFKNIMGIGILFCFEFLCGYSSTSPLEYSYIFLYNVVLTVFPPLIIGIFDRDVGPGVLMAFPELYKVGLLQQEFTHSRFVIYSIEGVFQSIVCFIVPYYAYRYGTVNDSGRVQEMYEMGLAMAVSSIAQVNIFAAVVSQAFCVYHVIFIWGSVALIFVYSVMYALLPEALSQMNPNYGFSRTVMGSATFWAVVVLTLVICNLPRLTARYIRRMWSPKDLDILQEICHLEHMNKHTLAPIDSTSVMDATSITDDNARGSSCPPCVGIDPVNAYSALGKHIRLDWTWGIVPSSAPLNKKRSTANIASLSDDMSIRSSTTTSFTEPGASLEDQTHLPGLPGLPIALSPAASHTVTPHMVQIAIPASRSPSPYKYPASIRSCDSARISASPRIMSTLVSVPSPSRHSLRRFQGAEAQSSLFGSGAVLRRWTSEMAETEDDNGTVMVTPEESNPGQSKVSRSASPTFVASSPPAQINISDPLSFQPPTPILGFGFAQEEGMADLILGTRFYSHRNTSACTATTSNSHPARSGSTSHVNKPHGQEIAGDLNPAGATLCDSLGIRQRTRHRMAFQRHGRYASDSVTQPRDLSRPRPLDFAVAFSSSLARPLTKDDDESG